MLNDTPFLAGHSSESAEEPVIAFVSNEDDEGNSRDDRIVLVTDRFDSAGDRIVVVQGVELNALVNNKNVRSNKVITSYGKNKLIEAIHEANKADRILFVDKKRSHEVVGTTEHQSFSSRNYDFTNNIEQFLANVNYKRGKSSLPHETYSSTALADAFKRAKPLKAPMKYSLDSEGRELTPGQQEFFKDSQARTEDGALRRLYHGTNNGGYGIFDPAMADDGRSLFFAGSRSLAESYINENANDSSFAFG